MSRRNSCGAGVLAVVTQTHLSAVRLPSLPQPAVEPKAAGRLAGERKPAKMPHLAVPCRLVPLLAA